MARCAVRWVDAQNRVTNAFLATLRGRDAIRARMTELYNYERFGLPEKAGNNYFYTRNDGLQNQAVLYVREGLNGTPRVLIDPNSWSQDGATALAEWDPSEDGRISFSVHRAPTADVRVLDVATACPHDEVRWSIPTSTGEGRSASLFALPEPLRRAIPPPTRTIIDSTSSARRRARTGSSTPLPTVPGSATMRRFRRTATG